MRLEKLEPLKGKLRQDLSGKKFNRLLVIECVGKRKKSVYYKCVCECGKEVITTASCIKSGMTKSCGCLHAEANKTRNLQHGLCNTSEYRIWSLMKDRCLNDNNKCAEYYKKRHIRVAYEWINSFEAFYKDMGKRPTKYHTIDRINTNFNYTKWNCRWATRQEQSRNLSSNTILTFNNESKCLAEWAEDLGMPPSTLSARLNKLGWPVEKALTTKIRKRK